MIARRTIGSPLGFVAAIVMALGLSPASAETAWTAPPPLPGTAADLADRAAVAAEFSPERLAQANRDRFLDPFAAFSSILGPGFAPATLPATAQLLAEVYAAAGYAVTEAKLAFVRLRPYVVDPGAGRCPDIFLLEPDRSYPSGHATIGMAWAVVLAAVVPGRADALLARGADYGMSRVVCGVHWPSDVAAGAALGAAVTAALLADARFDSLVAAARIELATLTTP